MDWKEFLKPTKGKIALAVILAAANFFLANSYAGGEDIFLPIITSKAIYSIFDSFNLFTPTPICPTCDIIYERCVLGMYCDILLVIILFVTAVFVYYVLSSLIIHLYRKFKG